MAHNFLGPTSMLRRNKDLETYKYVVYLEFSDEASSAKLVCKTLTV